MMLSRYWNLLHKWDALHSVHQVIHPQLPQKQQLVRRSRLVLRASLLQLGMTRYLHNSWSWYWVRVIQHRHNHIFQLRIWYPSYPMENISLYGWVPLRSTYKKPIILCITKMIPWMIRTITIYKMIMCLRVIMKQRRHCQTIIARRLIQYRPRKVNHKHRNDGPDPEQEYATFTILYTHWYIDITSHGSIIDIY